MKWGGYNPHTKEQCEALAMWLQARFEEYPDVRRTRKIFYNAVIEARNSCLDFARQGHWDLATYRFKDCAAGDLQDIHNTIALLE